MDNPKTVSEEYRSRELIDRMELELERKDNEILQLRAELYLYIKERGALMEEPI